MFDGVKHSWHRELRRLWNEGTRGEMDDGADGTVIGVAITVRRRRWNRFRFFSARGGNRKRGAVVMKCVEMNVAERKSKL